MSSISFIMDNEFSLIEYYRKRAPEYESIYDKFDSGIQKKISKQLKS